MTRRDRAALVLAYEVLRAWGDPCGQRAAVHASGLCSRALDALRLGDDVSRAIFDAYMSGPWIDPRLLRARLALLLRVLLRADAGDFGEVACERCGSVGDGTHERGEACGACWVRYGTWSSYRPRRYTPLWDAARKAT